MAIGSYAIGSVPGGGVSRRFIVPIGLLSLGRILETPGRLRLGSDIRTRAITSQGRERSHSPCELRARILGSSGVDR